MSNETFSPKQLWKQEEAAKRRLEQVKQAVRTDTAYEGDQPDPNETEAKSDWQKLINLAKLKFPEHIAARFQLTPKQRVVCIATCIGWSVDKIAQASEHSTTTIYRWLKLDQAIEFMKLVEIQSGTRDALEFVDMEQFNSLLTLKELRDDTSISATTRADIAKWFVERKYGKAKESREIKDTTVRQLTEQLMRLDHDPITGSENDPIVAEPVAKPEKVN